LVQFHFSRSDLVSKHHVLIPFIHCLT
jgi:hypothetical protein